MKKLVAIIVIVLGWHATGAAYTYTCNNARTVLINSMISDEIRFGGDYDIYRINVPFRGTLKVYTTGPATCGLLSSGCSPINQDSCNPEGTCKIALVDAGTKFVRVYHRTDPLHGTGSYTLHVKFEARCTYEVYPERDTFSSSGGAAVITVTTEPTTDLCRWTATKDASWIHFTSSSSGRGDGTLGYSVDPKSSTSSRYGTITVEGEHHRVTQGGIPCNVSPPTLTIPANGYSANMGSDITLQWTAGGGTSWTLEILKDGGSFLSQTTTTPSYTFSPSEGQYQWKVAAKSEICTSSWSDTSTFKIVDPCPAPGKPTSGTCPSPSTTGTFNISWSQVIGADGYILERASNPFYVGCQQIYSGPSLSYQEVNLSIGSYCYRVKAVKDCGSSSDWGWSCWLNVDTQGPVLDITSHTDNQQVVGPSAKIKLGGIAIDDAFRGGSGIQQVTVNGVRSDNDEATGVGIANWSKQLTLQEGNNAFTVVAYDNSPAHHNTTKIISIYYDHIPFNAGIISLLLSGEEETTADKRCIPDTGQTQSYTSIYGEDSDYTFNPPSYTKLDSSGTLLSDSATSWAMVKDNVTGLIWEVKTNDGSIHDKDNEYTFADAKSVFIAQLNGSKFGSHSDWRLPTVHELSQIQDLGKFNPAIDSNYFPNMPPNHLSDSGSWYWSSNEAFTHSWSVDFKFGMVQWLIPASGEVINNYAIAVRGNKVEWGNQFFDNGDGTVSDLLTGLMWQKVIGFSSDGLWESNISYCEGRTLGGHNDWRLPNRKELQTLAVYESSTYININPRFCPVSLQGGVCIWSWPLCSSTTYAGTDQYGRGPDNSTWGVRFGTIGGDPQSKESCYDVLCVRGGAN